MVTLDVSRKRAFIVDLFISIASLEKSLLNVGVLK